MFDKRPDMPKIRLPLCSPTLRVLLVALLLGLVPACSDDETAPGGSSGSAGRAGGSGAQSAGEGGKVSAGDTGTGAGAGADEETLAGSAGQAGSSNETPGEAGSAGTGTAGSGGSSGSDPGSVGDICEQVAAFLTSCGQLQGAGEAAQNCDPNLALSQCIVPCLLAKPCADVGDWPAPILGCISDCGG